MKEAEQFHAAGFADILYAVGLAPHRVARAYHVVADPQVRATWPRFGGW